MPLQMGTLPHNFFDHDVETVAKALLGVSLLTVDQYGNKVGGRIVETEAYDQNDCAAHCYCPDGKRSLKMGSAEAMFLAGGHAYVYRARSYWCLNLVCGDEHFGSAVLIRALAPETGMETMRERHRKNYESAWVKDEEKFVYSLCDGPGKLCVSLGIGGSLNREPLNKLPFEFQLNTSSPQIASGPRIRVQGLIEKSRSYVHPSQKDEAITRRWRFVDNTALAFVSEKRSAVSVLA
jgi:DNA-3-methyladenine glycosylase